MAKFVLITSYPSEKTSERLEVRPQHREYLGGLLEKGKLFASGPWVDDTGACVIYEAADEAEARALFEADPFAQAGVADVVSLKEWNPVRHAW